MYRSTDSTFDSSAPRVRNTVIRFPMWSSVAQCSRTGLTLLALYFSRHFRSQQLWSHSQFTKTLATDELRRVSSSDYSLIFDMLLCPWDDSARVNTIYLQATHIGTVKNCLSPSLGDFHWIHTTPHTFLPWTYTRIELVQYSSAPQRQELVTSICQQGDGRVSTAMQRGAGLVGVTRQCERWKSYNVI